MPHSNPDLAQAMTRLQALVPAVLARLGQVTPLPPHGTVAGQAVASVLWGQMGLPIQGPINDIDVFVNPGLPRPLRGLEELSRSGHATQQSERFPSNRRVGTTEHRRVGLGSDYSNIPFITSRAHLRILHTYRSGLLNFTLICNQSMEHGAHTHDNEVSQDLVNGFDLNAVGVGINLDTGTLVASQGFLEFLESHELKAHTCNTPAHTLIRLAKKYHLGELKGVRCDYEQQRIMLELALACQGSWETYNESSKLGAVRRFGKHYKGLYEKLKQHLPGMAPIHEPHAQEGKTNYTLYQLLPRSQWDNPADRALLQWTRDSSEEEFQGSATPILVSDFPRVWELMRGRAMHLDLREREKRLDGLAEMGIVIPGREKMIPPPTRKKASPQPLSKVEAIVAFLEALEKKTLHNLQAMLKATGRNNPRIPLPGAAKTNSALFFIDQACATDPALVNQAALAWKQMSDFEKGTMRALDLRADWALSWKDNPIQAWARALEKHGMKTACELVRHAHKTQESQPLYDLLDGLLDYLDVLGEGAEKIREALMSIFEGSMVSDHLGLVDVLGAGKGKAIAHRMIQWMAPGWPDLSGVDPEAAIKAIGKWVDVGLKVPDQAIDGIDPSQTLMLMEEAGINTAGTSRERKRQSTAARQGLFGRLLEKLPADRWGDHQAAAVRGALHMGAEEALADAARHIGPSDALDQALDTARRALTTPNSRPKGYKHPWDLWWPNNQYFAGKMVDALERIQGERRLEKALEAPCDSIGGNTSPGQKPSRRPLRF